MTPLSHPGRLLRREIAARGISGSKLAIELGVPSGRIADILSGRRAITADTAVRLGRYLGTPAQFWLGLQADYDLEEAQRSLGKALARVTPIAA